MQIPTSFLNFECAWRIAAILLVAFTHNVLSEEVVLTAKPASPADNRYEYPEMVLKRVLDVTADTYGRASMQQANTTMSRNRTLSELIDGDNIHVAVEPAKPDWASKLIPVYIPVRKGIGSYRIYLIDRKYQKTLSQISTLEELKRIPTGAGAQWSTAAVMKQSGFNLVTGTKFDSLFWMLMGDRFRTFARGINEAPQELAARRSLFPDMAIEKDLALYLPFPNFFFVSPAHPRLAKRVEAGMKLMMEDGSFDEIFFSYHLDMIESANLNTRKIFYVKNPTLPKEVPLDNKAYWFQPGDEVIYKAKKNL